MTCGGPSSASARLATRRTARACGAPLSSAASLSPSSGASWRAAWAGVRTSACNGSFGYKRLLEYFDEAQVTLEHGLYASSKQGRMAYPHSITWRLHVC